jgi:small subunit ribosomal protein S3
VVIERPAKLCRISIYAARPGVIIGKKGADIEKLRSKLASMTASEVKLNIVEIRKPEIDAKLVAQGVADQLVRRVAFRRAMKRAMQSALRLGAEASGSPAAAVSAAPRSPASNGTAKGRVPLHTLRANVDYAEAEALTAYGHHRHQVLDLQGRDLRHDPMAQDRLMMDAQTSGVRRRVEVEKPCCNRRKTKFRKAFKGRISGDAKGGTALNFRRLRPQGARARADHRAPDRGRAPRDHAPHQAPGAPVDPRVPRTCRSRRSRPKSARARARVRSSTGPPASSRAGSCSSSTAFPARSPLRRSSARR